MAAFATGGSANFIPEIFSKKLQSKFYSASVLPMISNTDYEGEISGQGDKVIIRTVPNVTVADYTGTISYQDVTTSNIELLIDKAKSYAFKVDDILRAQSDIQYWNEASKDASESMRIAVETDFLANVVTGATSTVDDGAVTASTILDAVLEAARRMDELNIPDSDRFIVLPPWAIEMLKKSDLKLAYLTGDSTSPIRNGVVGNIDRFKVMSSNLLSVDSSGGADDGKTFCLAGHPKFATFASQFVKTETVRLESTFGDGVRGLKVYGYKVVTPDCGVLLKLKAA
ncbi:MAG: hypothetical protein EB075_02465 [Bacteroidetes bacterium]|nr:hypothetical protein [Bacteroidota bacterium]